MQASLISVFCFLPITLLCAVNAAADNEFSGAPDLAGFRGMKWGANVSDFQGLVKLNDEPFVQRYSKINDQLQIGGIGLEAIIYNFYKGRFMGVSIETRGTAEWKQLKDLVFERFGPAPDISAHVAAEQYEWRAGRSITHLQFFQSNRLVKLWIVSAEISGLKDKGR